VKFPIVPATVRVSWCPLFNPVENSDTPHLTIFTFFKILTIVMIVHLASCCKTAEPVPSRQGIADVEERRKKA
jgi:hypothetical protein